MADEDPTLGQTRHMERVKRRLGEVTNERVVELVAKLTEHAHWFIRETLDHRLALELHDARGSFWTLTIWLTNNRFRSATLERTITIRDGRTWASVDEMIAIATS